MDVFLSELITDSKALFLSGDWELLGVVLAIALITTMITRGIGQLLGASVVAMLATFFALGLVDTVKGETPSDPAAYLAALNGTLGGLMESPGGMMITLTTIFVILVLALMILKSIVFRGDY
ncbi:MAG: hypothetical protein AAGC77_13770 [Pseudomonadota bacterium]